MNVSVVNAAVTEGGQGAYPLQGVQPDIGSGGTPPVQFAEGEKVQAEVTEVKPDGKLTFKLSNGQQFLAEVLSDKTLVPGQRVTLTVMEARGGIPAVEIAKVWKEDETDAAARSRSAETFLKAMKAPVNEQTLALAREALAQQASFTPKQFAALAKTFTSLVATPLLRSQLSTVNSPLSTDFTAEQAVFMARHHIPVSRETVAQYRAVTQPQAQLGALLQKLLDILPPERPAAQTPAPQPVQTQQPVPQAPQKAVQTQPIQPQQPMPQTPQPQTPTPPPQSSVPQTAQAQQSPQTPQPAPQAVQVTAQPVPAPINVVSVPIPAAPVGDVAPDVPQTARQQPAQPGGMTPTLQQSVPQPTPQPIQTEQPPQTVRKLLDALFARTAPDRKLALPRELDIPKQTREIGRLLTQLIETSREWPPQQRTELLNTAREIVQILRFAEQINHCTAFAQIPVDINGEKTTAQLYVFNDSNEKKKIDPQNATLFVSLHTMNLGMVEGFLKVIGQGVEADFTLRTEEAAQLFRAGLLGLSDLLEARGYRLERVTAAVAREEEPLPPAAVEKGRAVVAGKYTFNRVI
jgi:hypothetical protein